MTAPAEPTTSATPSILDSRERDPADRRRHLVTLTPAGEKQLASASRAQKDTEDALFASLDDRRHREVVSQAPTPGTTSPPRPMCVHQCTWTP